MERSKEFKTFVGDKLRETCEWNIGRYSVFLAIFFDQLVPCFLFSVDHLQSREKKEIEIEFIKEKNVNIEW
jgi:hypothetical protein